MRLEQGLSIKPESCKSGLLRTLDDPFSERHLRLPADARDKLFDRQAECLGDAHHRVQSRRALPALEARNLGHVHLTAVRKLHLRESGGETGSAQVPAELLAWLHHSASSGD
jgi:hypothetical protein